MFFQGVRGIQVECVQHGLRTIAFCKTRKLCELVITYTREMLRQSAPHLSHAISVYRAGYNPTVGFLCFYKHALSCVKASFCRG